MLPVDVIQLGVIAIGASIGVVVYLAQGGKRRAIEKATGGRIRMTFGGQVLSAEPRGLPLSILLQASGHESQANFAAVTIAVSLSPQADFLVGPKNIFAKPLGQLFSSLPPLEQDIPWLREWQARGAPEKAAAEILSRVVNLEDFISAGWKPKQFACKGSKLELMFETRWKFEPSNLKALVELSADLAFRLMG